MVKAKANIKAKTLMTKIHRTALVPYSAENLYSVVNDVANYPEFLPWCAATQIHYESSTEMKASVIAKKSGIEKKFTTHNHLIPHKAIKMNFSDGPFEYLNGCWEFKNLSDQGCKVSLDLEFEFKKGLMSFAFKKIFEPAADAMMQAFIDRANKIYGK